MNKMTTRWIIFANFLIVFGLGISPALGAEFDKNPTLIRLGWQIPLATQGQIIQVLMRTDLLAKQGIESQFVPFSYGGPQSEAALAGQLDAIFVGDQPAINLIARGGKWKIVSRLFYTRTAIMVPPNSPIKKLTDLKDKFVASPFGSVAHREAIFKEQEAGLIPNQEVTNLNLDILEISNLVQVRGKKSWGKIDAVTVWEPSASLFESKKLARVLDYTRTLGVIAISEDFIAKHPDQTVGFLAATLQAWAYFATHTDEVNQWYIQDAKLTYTPQILSSAAKVEPNYSAKNISEIDLSLNSEHIIT